MLSAPAEVLNLDEICAAFARDGFAFVGRVANTAALAALREATQALMLGTASYPEMFFQHDAPTGRYEDLRYGDGWVGPSLNYRKLEGLELDPVCWAWINNPAFKQIADRIVGPEVRLYRAVLWNKAARAGTELPWHQDDGKFWGIDRAPQLQIWTALDEAVAASGCVEALRGTHQRGLASGEGGTIQSERVQSWNASPVPLEARAGDVWLIHNHVWHRSRRNRTDAPRRAISVSYLHADTRCRRRKRAPREFRRVFV